MGDEMDSLFASFMGEVSSLKSTKMKKREMDLGTPDEIVERLTASKYDPRQGFGSAYVVLQINPEATESEVTKQYRKISLLIHPDKCKLEKAPEAFQVLAKAYADTKDPNYNDKYQDIIGPAKERVKKAREEENRERRKRREDPLDMEGGEFDRAVMAECDRMLNQTAETATYQNSVLEANLKRQEQSIKEGKMRKREEDQQKRNFEKNRDKRAAGWQTFMQNVESKKFKSQHFLGKVGVADTHHKREQRDVQTHGKAELDMEDKKIKRSDSQAGMTGIDQKYKKQWR